jgi:hypothetical protein
MVGSFDNKGRGPDSAGKRPGPTIDGTATEVTVEPAAEEAGAATGEAAAKDDEAAKTDQATLEPPAADDDDEQAEERAADDERPEEKAAPPPRPRGSRIGSVLSHLTAGILGGLVGAGAIAFAWTYLPTNQPAEAPDLKPLEDRLAALESAPEAPDAGPEIAQMESRLDALESKKPEAPSEVAALADRVSQLEANLKSMAEAAKQGGSVADAAATSQQINAAEQRLDDKITAELNEAKTANDASIEGIKKDIAAIDAKLKALTNAELGSGDASQLVPEIAGLDDRIGKLESILPTLANEVDKGAEDTKAATLAIAFANLRTAVNEGRPYATELATLAALSPGNGDLGPLLEYDDEGIPTIAQLKVSFEAARYGALAASAPDASASLANRLMASAESLVKVKRIDAEAEGDTPDAVLARAAAKLDQGDLAAAVKEVEILKDAPHAAFDKWLDQAKARLSAEVTLQHLQSLLLVSLGDGKTPSKTDEQD